MKRSLMNRGTSQLSRTGFRKEPMLQPGVVAAPKKRKALKPKKFPPTVEESRWMAAISELGCVVCLKHHQVKTPAAVHHIVEGSRRLGHFYTIPLCDPGHHQNSPSSQKLSRHPNKARFEKRYGTEYELLAYVQTILNWKPV